MVPFLKKPDRIPKKIAAKKLSSKDNWDKADIVLKTLGSLFTGICVAAVGLFGSQYLSHKQDAETNVRLYTELMSKREEADNSLRKDMFNSFIANFLKPEPADLEQKVLNVELLAFNFHESIDFSPLFHNVRQQVVVSNHINEPQKDQLLTRLKNVSTDIVSKQIFTLAESGGKYDCRVDFEKLAENPAGIDLFEEEKVKPEIKIIQEKDTTIWKVKLEALKLDTKKEEIRLRLEIREELDVIMDVTFRIGYFNFPMINNFRLPKGQRCAIALSRYSEETAELIFLYFPASRASLKDKPYYDEVIYNLTHAPREILNVENTSPH